MMNPKIKAKWMTALRSGDYKQAKGQLKESDKFCCMGVLIDIQDQEYLRTPGNNVTTSVPPDRFMAGLTTDQCCDLAKKNDGRWSFEEIAGYIEMNL